MNLSEIDPKRFIPMGPDRKSLLVERIGKGYEGRIVIPAGASGAKMSKGAEPPELTHLLPKKCRVLAVGPKVRSVKVGDIVNVPGHGNCYADWEDGKGEGSRLLIREGDIAFIYNEASAQR
jgi:hypothetical protein